MCLSPIKRFTPQRYVSLRHGEQFCLELPCGQCCECQQKKSYEWQMRSYYEFYSHISNGGYVLFDTLTYDDRHLPHFSDHFPEIDSPWLNHSCFSREDIRLFFVGFRRQLEYRGYSPHFGYFLAAEYGADDRYTHRPHYHVLFFLDSSIPPLVASRLISKVWKRGRTDGVPFKSKKYVISERVYSKMDSVSLVVSQYVAKYVVKHSTFRDVVNQRVDSVVSAKFDDVFSRDARSFRLKLKHQIDEFHTSSNHYGEFGLGCIDMPSLYTTGMVSFPVADLSINRHIPLPLYYKRKLFEKQVEIDGKRQWIKNDDGKKYARASLIRNERLMRIRIDDAKRNGCVGLGDSSRLAHYIVCRRGRFKSNIDFDTIVDKLNTNESFFYGYSSLSDIEKYEHKFLTSQWLGNDVVGYRDDYCRRISYTDFARSFVLFDSRMEEQYDRLCDYNARCKLGVPELFDYRLDLENKLVSLGLL